MIGTREEPAADCTIEQNWQMYRQEEHAVWRFLFERQQRLLVGRACREYLEGLAGLGAAVAAYNAKSASATSATADALSSEAQLLTASDVVWEQLYRQQATQELKAENVTGVVVPKSTFVTNTEIVSSRSFGVVLQHLKGATTGGTPSGLHGDQLVSVVANPGGTPLSTSPST